MKFLSNQLRHAVAAAACILAVAPAVAAEEAAAYPSKPIKILVPFPPGGAADNFARIVGQKLNTAWSQPVLIENRPGASGQIATQAAATAPADGYTLLVVTVGHAVNPALYPKLPYNTERDLQPVAALAQLASVVLVNPSVPAKTVGELVALAKAQPRKLTYASAGNASTSHVAGAMFTSLAQVEMVHVPYRGSAPAITDLMGGQIDMMIDPIVSSAQHVKSGKLRALAVSTARRSSLTPDLPTVAEAGVPNYDFSSWFLLLAPRGVPEGIVQKINRQVASVLAQPDTKDKFNTLGAEPGSGSPSELASFLGGEIKRLAKVAKDSGMKAE